MQALKTKFNHAEKIKKKLAEKNLFDRKYKVERGKTYIYFPVVKKDPSFLVEYPGTAYITKTFTKKTQKKEYKDYLKLSNKEKTTLPTSFDIIGDIIIIELKGTPKKEESKIGKALLKANKNIKTILKKSGNHEGEFRTRNLSFVTGENKKETTYIENKTKLSLDVEKVYFSPRLSTERKRICAQIKEGEEILVMFSGCGPYPLVISKNTKAKKLLGIEKNKIAHKYAIRNLSINKISNVEFVNADVREAIPKLKQKFNRILMPLPKGAEDFLDLAFSVSKKGTIIHFYDFEKEGDFKKGEKKVIKKANTNSQKIKILRTVKCGQYSPGKYRICIDFLIE